MNEEQLQEMASAFEVESLLTKIGDRVEERGPVIDAIPLRDRRRALVAEATRLRQFLNAYAKETELPTRDLLEVVPCGARIAVRRVFMKQIPKVMRVTNYGLMHAGYLGAASGDVLFVTTAKVIGAELPAKVAYVVPKGSIEYWREVRRGTLLFSLVAAGPITKVVFRG